MALTSPSPAERRIEDWRQRLIDLSRRNPLLYFRAPKGSSLTITSPNVQAIFDRLVIQEKPWAIWLPPEETESASDPQQLEFYEQASEQPVVPGRRARADEIVCKGTQRKDLERILKNLYRRSNTDYQERGVRILYVALGSLQWKEQSGPETIHSPLMLCPVELKRETSRDPFVLGPTEEDLVLNPALRVKLKRDFGLTLPAFPEDWEQNAFDRYLDDLRRLVAPLAWTVEPETFIGLFSFHKLVIYQDLEENAACLKAHPMVNSLSGVSVEPKPLSEVPPERELDNLEKAEQTYQILDADGSQRQCIQAALQGYSLVLQGPPGTGKSQTIANIIAECIARGKSVMFVSEKMAALDVVFDRLKKAGLSNYCFELHSHKKNKRDVIDELKRCLDEVLVPNQLPEPMSFTTLNRLRERLNGYVEALHAVRQPLGISLFQVLGTLAKLDGVRYAALDLPNANRLSPTELQEWEETVQRLSHVWVVAEEGPRFPWSGCLDDQFTLASRDEWARRLRLLDSTREVLKDRTQQFALALGVDAPANLEAVQWLIQVGTQLRDSPNPYAAWLQSSHLEELLADAKKYRQLNERYWQIKNALAPRYHESFFGMPSGTAERLNSSWTETIKLLGYTVAQNENLQQRGRELLQFVEDTRQWAGTCLRDAKLLAQHFGLSSDLLTLDRARELAQLAVLTTTPHRPEAQWLVALRWQEAHDFVAKQRPEYEAYNQRKRELLANYSEAFYELDLDELIDHFSGLGYRTFLKHIHPGYRKDKKLIVRTTRAASLPASVLDDLVKARELRRSRAKIESESERAKILLGTYYRAFDTHFDQIEQALDVAAEILKLARQEPLPPELVDRMCVDQASVAELSVLGARILEGIQKWELAAEALGQLVSEARLSNGQPIRQSDLAGLGQWAGGAGAPLTTFCDLHAQALSHANEASAIRIESLIDDLRNVADMQVVQAHMNTESDALRVKFGDRYAGLNTAWDDVLTALTWTHQVRDLFGMRPIPARFIELASRGGTNYGPLLADVTLIDRQFQELLGAFEQRFAESAWALADGKLRALPLTEIESRLDILARRLDDLQWWADYGKLKGRFESYGLGDLFSQLQNDPPPAGQLRPIFRRAIYQAWVNSVYDTDPRLSEFRARNHEQVIQEFRELDQRLVRLASQRIIAEHNARRPQTGYLPIQDSEVMVLRREAAKRIKHLAVRRLFDRIPNLLQQLKPCLLMSPLSVSQFLNPAHLKFDLVIFDEASQIFTEDAIGAIYRGQQLIVAGDSKQLPPTDFFKTLDSDEEDLSIESDELQTADFNSVLDECSTILPSIPNPFLKWHYRSRHESLIAYSNYRFYNHGLITFPSAHDRHEALGVKFVHVPDGVYDRGGKRNNQREAQEVADLVFDHFVRYPQKSLGVVAFSQSQMTAIDDEIELRRREHPELDGFFQDDRLQGFFVKNLENVQGDERDVIIFSVGYGYDQNHRITMNFGPLNRPGGERRLNVAVTRARDKIYFVSSIKASDIDLSSTTSGGALHLYHYLDYAERGQVALELANAQGTGEPESPLEEEVAGEIRRMGYEVALQVGVSSYRIDIGVLDPSNPGHFLLGVECDGATYHSAATARDRDRLRQQVLEKLGWRIHRIWSPDWVSRRQAEIDRLRKGIEDTRARGPHTDILDTPDSMPPNADNPMQVVRIAREPGELGDVFPGTVPYQLCRLDILQWAGTEFHEPKYRDVQADLIRRIVAREGPVHIELVARRILDAWGVSRRGTRITDAIEEAMRYNERRHFITLRGKFLWPPDLTDAVVRTPDPNSPDTLRDIDHIAPEEIQAAMLLIVKHALSLNVESLINNTARLYGFVRTTDKVSKRLTMEYQTLLRAAVFKEQDNLVSLH